MPKLFGKQFSRRSFGRGWGAWSSSPAFERGCWRMAAQRGTRVADFWTGTGLEFSVLLDHGMDISAARWQGKSLCWMSSAGVAHPAYYEPEGPGMAAHVRWWPVTTCGLTYAGAPTVDQGEELGLHGRVPRLPAESVHLEVEWDGDDYVIWASGKVREARVFGENIVLSRKIFTRLGENRFWIHDRVENEGYQTTEHMLLYHINLGFPWWMRARCSSRRHAACSRATRRRRRSARHTPSFTRRGPGIRRRCTITTWRLAPTVWSRSPS